MRCSEVCGAAAPLVAARVRGCLRALAGLLLVLAGHDAFAHKSSDAYLRLDAAPGKLDVRWDIALRDLDVALDLDSDGDGKLTWGEVRTAWPRIEAYALPQLSVRGCALAPQGRSLERRSDGAYAVLSLASTCTLPASPGIGYGLFADVDPTHRGIARIQRPGQAPELVVLQPTANVAAASASGGAGEGGRGSSGAAAADTVTPWQFVREGVHHIVTGYDHVLFLLCLLLPSVMRRTAAGWRPVERLAQAVWPLAGIVTAFTVAHSITLALASLKIVSLSPAVIEPAIALTIVLAAVDNLRPIFPVRRFVVAFFFGLVHGFGFASVLGELDLPAGAFAWALLQFNLGLEAGQLLIVVLVTALLFGLRKRAAYPAFVIGAGSTVAIAIGLAWLLERTAGVAVLPL
ncbi:MAG TPA: HupE/UreJ family protein [Caldimonas sp.]|jgi:hypothetical protein|nr:HupE/UreJ family protein [Caldimonas sp.]HEX2541803.1 HupE/UreJ family protein [Caldimonas sp.]